MTVVALSAPPAHARTAAAVALLLLLGGCISLYIPPFGSIKAERLGEIKVGSTTRQEVVALLGEPGDLKHENFSVYDLYSSKGFLVFLGALPRAGFFVGVPLDTRQYRVLLEFDADSVVKRFEIQEGVSRQPKISQVGSDVTASPEVPDAEIKRTLKGVVRGLWGQTLEMQFRSVAFSPDGRIVAAGDFWKQIWLWDTETGEQKMVLKGAGSFVRFSPDGKLLVTAGETTPTLWELPSGAKKLSFEGHGSSGFFTSRDVRALAFSPDSKMVISGAVDGSVRVWDVATGKVLRTLDEQESITSVIFSHDGNILAATSKEVILWELATGRELRRITVSSEERARALSPDGKLLAVATLSHVEIWRLPPNDQIDEPAHAESGRATNLTGRAELITVFLLPRYSFNRPSVVFSSDGSKVGASAGGAVIGDLFTRHAILGYYPAVPIGAGTEHDFFARDLAFSPDGETVAIATDKGVYLSDVPASERLNAQRLPIDQANQSSASGLRLN